MERILLIVESEDLHEGLMESLSDFQVDICKPYEAAEALARLQPDALDDADVIDNLFAQLRLRGKPRVLAILRTAIQIALRDPDYMLTKDVYPVLAKEYGSNTDAVDQAFRRMLRRSWARREENAGIWEGVLPGCTKCPTNGEFITAVALYLHKKYPSRFRKGL